MERVHVTQAIWPKWFQPADAFIEFSKEEVEQSVPDRFEQMVRKYPDHIAVKTRNFTLTYDALNKSANRLAHSIPANCGRALEPAIVLLENDAPMIVAVFGLLKAGKVCVPLDPAFHQGRASYVLEESQAKLIITNSRNLSLARELAGDVHRIINMDAIDDSLSSENLALSIPPDHFAFILYTSGSTGQPRGVLCDHRFVLDQMRRYTNSLRIRADDRMTLFISGSGGHGSNTFLSALLNGAGLHMRDLKEEGLGGLANWIMTEKISMFVSTPTVFRNFVATLGKTETFPRLRLIKLGSESVRKADVEEFHKHHFPPESTLVVWISTTESGNFAHHFIDKQTAIAGDPVPVGYPAQDIEVLLLDDAGKAVGVDQVGEIALRSQYLACGYWRRPDFTEAKFLPDPDGGAKRIFLTGDLGRMLPNGCLVHLGRKDFRVKIRGYAVDITELEKVLCGHSSVREAVVVVSQDKAGEKRLVAYFTPANGTGPSVGDLRSFLKEKLADYMIPSDFVSLDAFPLRPNGKVDRQALPLPTQKRSRRDTSFVPPFETVEHQLAQIWEELLGVRPVGIRDNFFELGGHSLLAARMVHRVDQVCGQKVPLATLFAGATIEQLARALIQQRVEQDRSLLVQVQAGGDRRPLFFMHGDFEGGGFYCLNLARALGEDQPFYALAPHGVDGSPIPPTIEAIAASFIEMIRTVQPTGPYLLGGLCKGGVTAYEMARQLQKQGEQVDLVMMVGSTMWNSHFKFLRRLVCGVGYLCGMGPERRASLFLQWLDRLSYAVRLYRCAIDRLKQVARMSLSEQFACARHLVKTAGRIGPEPEYMGKQYYHKQLGGYVPGTYSGKVVLYWAGKEPSRHPFGRGLLRGQTGDPTLGLGRVVGDLEVHILPGVSNTAITKDVKILADHMRSCLNHVQSNGKKTNKKAAGK